MSHTPFCLVSGDFVTTGGMDRANYALADYLARSGHAVELVAHRIADDLAARPNVRFHAVPKVAGSYFLSEGRLNRAGQTHGNRMVATGGRVLANGGNCRFADVNWVHYVHAAYRPDSAVSLLRRLKRMIQRPIDLRHERHALSRAKLVFANSLATRAVLLDRLGLTAERVKVVYYGNDRERFCPATPSERAALRERFGWDARPRVMFIGALGDRRKGFDTLFTAWQSCSKQPGWDAELVVVGSGAELAAWRERASGMAIQFLGFRSDVPDLLRASDALVAPTRYEAYGLGVQEALGCGLPAFVSAEAGVAEQYTSDLADLLLPDANDANDLAQRLNRWRNAPDRWRERLAPVTAQLHAYSWDDMAASMLQTIEGT